MSTRELIRFWLGFLGGAAFAVGWWSTFTIARHLESPWYAKHLINGFTLVATVFFMLSLIFTMVHCVFFLDKGKP